MAPKYTVVTSFSPAGYDIYGKRFLETFAEFWPKEVALQVYYEREAPLPIGRPMYANDLYDDPEFLEFKGTCPPDGADFRWQTLRFAHKVFAITDPDEMAADLRATPGWRIWLDADVETFRPVTLGWLAEACPEDKQCSYLGRKELYTSELG